MQKKTKFIIQFFIKKNIQKLFSLFNLKIVRIDSLLSKNYTKLNYAFLDKKNELYLKYSKSQFGQDYLVNLLTKNKNPFFVEFGAVDGIQNSNTYYLEKVLKWKGILCEPSKKFSNELKKNRNCFIDLRCVYKSSNEKIYFTDVSNSMGANGISKYLLKENTYRPILNQYRVNTVSLYDLLIHYNAPFYIDFLSIDTEGSEYDILKDFKFDKFSFGLILVEHANDHLKRRSIYNLLKKNNYIRLKVDVKISKFDDWYASPSIFKEFKMRTTTFSFNLN